MAIVSWLAKHFAFFCDSPGTHLYFLLNFKCIFDEVEKTYATLELQPGLNFSTVLFKYDATLLKFICLKDQNFSVSGIVATDSQVVLRSCLYAHFGDFSCVLWTRWINLCYLKKRNSLTFLKVLVQTKGAKI